MSEIFSTSNRSVFETLLQLTSMTSAFHYFSSNARERRMACSESCNVPFDSFQPLALMPIAESEPWGYILYQPYSQLSQLCRHC